jgi:hypothetical protein
LLIAKQQLILEQLQFVLSLPNWVSRCFADYNHWKVKERAIFSKLSHSFRWISVIRLRHEIAFIIHKRSVWRREISSSSEWCWFKAESAR